MFIRGDTHQIILSFVSNEYEVPGDYDDMQRSHQNANDDTLQLELGCPSSNNCFVDATGPWNTVGRTITKTNGATVDFEEPGFAAEGKICGFPTGSTIWQL